MTVYWCDPYVNAIVGGIHGTTETTTRTGTYAAPFSWADVNNASSANFPGVTLVDQDEIRIKGLANVSAFLIDIGSDWYCSNYYTLLKNTTGTVLSSEKTAKSGQNGYAFIIDPAVTERYMVANSAGAIPPYIFTAAAPDADGQRLYTYSSGGQAGFWNAVLIGLYPITNKNMQVYLIDPDYYVSVENQTGYTYPFCKDLIDLKVTDGWTSETVRNGVCILALEATNMGGTERRYYFNSSTNARGYGTWYDCLNTYFVAVDTDDTNCYARPYFWTNSAGGTYAGADYTQKYGGFIKTDGGYPNYLYEGYYYNGAGASNDSDACNSVEVGITSCYYGVYAYSRYGTSHQYRINNLFGRASGAGNFNMYNYSGDKSMDLYVGSMFTYSGNGGAFINFSTNGLGGDGPDITFMDSATLCGYDTSAALFNNSDADLISNITFGSVSSPIITQRDYPDKFASLQSTGGPTFVAIAGPPPAYTPDVKMSPSTWTEASGILYDGRTSTPHDLSEANLSLGNMLTDDSDYRNTDVDIQVKTDMYLYSTYGANGHTYHGDVNMHFSSNDYDGKPVGVMPSVSQNNNFHIPLIYYNDSAEENALVVQGNARAVEANVYSQKLEIPIPKYTTEDIRISINWKVSANWPNNRYVRMSVGHASATGWDWANFYSNSNPISTNSSYTTTTLDIANADLPTLQLNHMKIGIDIQNPFSHVHKLYIKTIEASVV